MKRSGSIVLFAMLAMAFALGVLYLFNRQFAGGDAYPAYSTLRSDPAGAKLIFESLRRLTGVTVVRGYLPLDRVPDRDSSVLLLGLAPHAFAAQQSDELHMFEKFAERGNRLVLAMGEAAGRQPPEGASLEQLWGVRFGLDFDQEGRGNLYFAAAKGWIIIESAGARLLLIERDFGKGSIVLVARGALFANRSVAGQNQTALLVRIIGPHTRIVFDEAHLGIVESGSIVALARRFRLHGLALGLAVIAILFIWKNTASFPPAAATPRDQKVSGRTSVAGLVTLLRKHIAPERLASACWQEWLKSHARDHPAARRAPVEDAIRNHAGQPVEALREIQTIVRPKGAI